MPNHLLLAAAMGSLLAAAPRAQTPPSPAPAVSHKQLPAKGDLDTWPRLERRRLKAAAPAGSAVLAPRTPGGGGAPQLAVAELELNNSIARADAFGTQTDFDGMLATFSDQDVVRLTLAQDADVVLTVDANGTSPVPDPDLLVTDAAGQFVAYNNDRSVADPYPLIAATLPAGTYYLSTVAYAGAGTYRMRVVTAPVSVPSVTHNQVINGTLTASRSLLYRLVLAADSRVAITMNGGPLDLVLELLRPTGSRYYRVDDAVGRNPGIDTHLPAGTYYLRIRELQGLAGNFTFQATVTAQTIPAVPCGSQVTGALANDSTLTTYKLALATAATVRFETRAATTTPVSDTVLGLHDRNLNTIFEQDDNDTSLYSLLSVPLPAGTYFVTVRQYTGSGGGNFQLLASCTGAFNRLTASYGRNAGNLGTSGDTVAYRLDVGTITPVECLVDTSITSLSDPTLAVIDENGVLQFWNEDDPVLQPDSFGGRELARGTYSLLVREYLNRTGTFDLHVGTRAFFSDAANNRLLNLQGKGGHGIAMVAGVSTLPTPLPLPPPIVGVLLLDLAVWVPLPIVTLPASGAILLPTPNFNLFPAIRMQGLSFLVVTNEFVMTDLVR